MPAAGTQQLHLTDIYIRTTSYRKNWNGIPATARIGMEWTAQDGMQEAPQRKRLFLLNLNVFECGALAEDLGLVDGLARGPALVALVDLPHTLEALYSSLCR